MSAEHDIRADGYYDGDFALRRRRAASGLQRRSRVLWVLIWACSAVVLALVVMFMFYAGLFERTEGALTAKPGELSEAANVGELKFTGYDKKNQAYAITSDAAEQDEERPNIVHLKKVNAEMKLSGSGDVVFVTADKGTLDTEADTVRLDDNVRLKSTSGFTAELRTALVQLKKGEVNSGEPVVVHTPDGTIWANGLDLWERGKRIVFKDRVRVIFEVDDDTENAG